MADLGGTEAVNLFAQTLSEDLTQQFKKLLETKFLYQSVKIDVQPIFDAIDKRVLPFVPKNSFHNAANLIARAGIVLSEQGFSSVPPRGASLPAPTLRLENVKLYCSRCKAREAFSPTSWVDFTKEVSGRPEPRVAAHAPDFQLLAIVYQCETCKNVPVSFLIKRKAWKLTIEGRSPFERVDVPKFIPKPETWLFSGAIVASRTGNVLAGLFYFRCFIEQFARRQTGLKDRKTGDEILEAYQAILPEANRDHMPSLKSWYEKLSVPVHAAHADSDLFKEAQSAIEDHFDFRRLCKIPDAAPPEPSAQTEPEDDSEPSA